MTMWSVIDDVAALWRRCFGKPAPPSPPPVSIRTKTHSVEVLSRDGGFPARIERETLPDRALLVFFARHGGFIHMDAADAQGIIDALMLIGRDHLYHDNPTLRSAFERFLVAQRLSEPRIRVLKDGEEQ